MNKRLTQYTEAQLANMLRGAAMRLMPRGAWTQDADGRDAAGVSTSALSPEAVQFCLIGAIHREIGRGYLTIGEDAVLERVLGLPCGIECWNDGNGRRKKQVIDRLLNASIRLDRANEEKLDQQVDRALAAIEV